MSCGALKSDRGGRTSRSVRLDMEKIVEIRGLVRLQCFVDDGENFVMNALIDFLANVRIRERVKYG